MTPKIVDKEKRKKEIIEATLELFSEKGYEATSMSQIAELAGIGKGTIYEYFESKEELILNAVKAWVELMESEVEKQVREIDDPEERLRKYAHSSMAAFTSDKRIMRLFIAMLEIVVTDEETQTRRDLIHNTMQSVCRIIADIFRDGVSQGIFRPDASVDAEKIALNLLAYLDGIGMYFYVLKGQIDLEDHIDLYLDILLKSLRVEE